MSAIFDFIEGRYVSAIWFVGGEGSKDWMACLYRDLPDGPWTLVYRFRYYAGPDPNDPKDRKNSYTGSGPSEDRGIAALDHIASVLVQEGFGTFVSKLTPKTADPEVVYTMLMKEPWAHPIASAPGGGRA
jgi:hypothetical protein